MVGYPLAVARTVFDPDESGHVGRALGREILQ